MQEQSYLAGGKESEAFGSEGQVEQAQDPSDDLVAKITPENRHGLVLEDASSAADPTIRASEPPLDDYHQHEALDRASLFADMVGSYLLDHPYVQSNPELAEKVETAVSLLAGVYQEIGARHL